MSMQLERIVPTVIIPDETTLIPPGLRQAYRAEGVSSLDDPIQFDPDLLATDDYIVGVLGRRRNGLADWVREVNESGLGLTVTRIGSSDLSVDDGKGHFAIHWALIEKNGLYHLFPLPASDAHHLRSASHHSTLSVQKFDPIAGRWQSHGLEVWRDPRRLAHFLDAQLEGNGRIAWSYAQEGNLARKYYYFDYPLSAVSTDSDPRLTLNLHQLEWNDAGAVDLGIAASFGFGSDESLAFESTDTFFSKQIAPVQVFERGSQGYRQLLGDAPSDGYERLDENEAKTFLLDRLAHPTASRTWDLLLSHNNRYFIADYRSWKAEDIVPLPADAAALAASYPKDAERALVASDRFGNLTHFPLDQTPFIRRDGYHSGHLRADAVLAYYRQKRGERVDYLAYHGPTDRYYLIDDASNNDLGSTCATLGLAHHVPLPDGLAEYSAKQRPIWLYVGVDLFARCGRTLVMPTTEFVPEGANVNLVQKKITALAKMPEPLAYHYRAQVERGKTVWKKVALGKKEAGLSKWSVAGTSFGGIEGAIGWSDVSRDPWYWTWHGLATVGGLLGITAAINFTFPSLHHVLIDQPMYRFAGRLSQRWGLRWLGRFLVQVMPHRAAEKVILLGIGAGLYWVSRKGETLWET